MSIATAQPARPAHDHPHLRPVPSPAPAATPPAAPAAPATATRTMHEHTAELTERLGRVRAGEPLAQARQHSRGKLNARERLDLLLDSGSFMEVGSLRRHRATGFGLEDRRPHTDGVVTGWGTVDGRRVFVYAHDFAIFGGSLGEAHASKIHKIMDLAVAAGAPLVGLNNGAGARIQEGVQALAGYGGIFARTVRASGVIPQISVMLGPCAGGAAYTPALTDFVFMVRDTSHMFLTGPDVVTAVTGEVVTQEELGGADTHSSRSGVAAFRYDDEVSCLAGVRRLLSMLPANHTQQPPQVAPGDDPQRRCPQLLELVSTDPRKPYDMRAVIAQVVDDGELLQVHERFARNLICTFARLDGHVVGIVANQPRVKAGALDIAAAEKGARFVRTCDAFNIPLVTLVDVPGFLPGVAQEHGGIIRHGAKLLYAYCEATVPRVQLVLRKAYGGAYIVMDSPSIGADVSLAWPTNEIAVMGAEGAVDIVHRRELASAPDRQALRATHAAAYREQLMHPYYAAERGLVDEVIDPAETRRALVSALAALRGKTRPATAARHGNAPL